MKIVFEGWKRVVRTHTHNVYPVKETADEYIASSKGPIKWDGPLHAKGKVKNLSLTGDFMLTFSFEPEELQSWLLAYAQENPEAAIRLIAEAQAEAIIALKKNG
ncbi:hypothetical protein [Metapseudomonas otitidis]|uniref:hypothetical protein n=1 Tax=Metapseudomonas otitidis TaxID=319939 RepID=UPI0013F689FF|nr:hypothetical protein [Pseudomonas otitidis]